MVPDQKRNKFEYFLPLVTDNYIHVSIITLESETRSRSCIAIRIVVHSLALFVNNCSMNVCINAK